LTQQPEGRLVSLAKNPVPSGAVAGLFEGYDGAPLRYARWEATTSPRRGTVCLLQGRGEFIEKYFEVIADLRRRGFAIATMDWRGQGGSHRELADPMKGHIEDFIEYDKDLLRFMKDVVLPDCPPPFIALAHSMGGTVLLRNAAEPGSWFERGVLSAPMIALDPNKIGFSLATVRTYAEVAAVCGMSTNFVRGGLRTPIQLEAFEGNPLTADKERWMRARSVLEVSPRIGLGSPTIGWLRAAFRAMAPFADPGFAKRIRVPLLLMAAGQDTIVSTRAIEEFGVRRKVGRTILIPQARHEILQDTDAVRQRFWSAFDAYLDIDPAEVLAVG